MTSSSLEKTSKNPTKQKSADHNRFSSADRPRVDWVTPRVTYLIKGQPGEVGCEMRANPPLTRVLWRKRASVSNEWTARPPTSTRISISRVQFSDAGVYQCRGVNDEGLGEWSPDIHVIVKRLPYFLKRPRKYYQATAGRRVTIPCEAVGNPTMQITWKLVRYDLRSSGISRVLDKQGSTGCFQSF